MDALLSPDQMRAIEAAAIASGRVTGAELMERAGRGCEAELTRRWPAGDVTVLCGPGNNGGDGYVIARLLARSGRTVATVTFGDPDRLPPDAAQARNAWMTANPQAVQVQAGDDTAAQVDRLVRASSVVVDAMLGTGGDRPLPRLWHRPLHEANQAGVPILAVDALSGLDLNTGCYLAPQDARMPAADVTVSFQRPKLGHVLRDGPRVSGSVVSAEIGLGPELAQLVSKGARVVRLAGPGLLSGDGGFSLVKSGHKYDNGHALIVAGEAGHGGAARLAARAALRVGAGLVTLACPRDAVAENAARLPDAVMIRSVDTRDDLVRLLGDPRVTAVCAGPGLGMARARDLVPAVLAARRAVLDADALTYLAADSAQVLGALHPGCVLTPHAGEFARLFEDLASGAQAGRLSMVAAAEGAAARTGTTVLLKGPATVVADAASRSYVNDATGSRAAPQLATAGSGDVLAGIIAGLLARGLDPTLAAAVAAALHADAGRRFGPGLIADDLPELLPAVLADWTG